MTAALEILTSAASSVGAEALPAEPKAEGLIRFSLAMPPLPDGVLQKFFLVVRDEIGALSVREQLLGTLLPRFCPERHINRDGTFCLGWKEFSPPYPTSIATALQWWSNLTGFLKLQQEADELETWPKDLSWSHGDAAEYDARLEAAIQNVPKDLLSNLGHCRPKSGIGMTERLENRRQPCPCGSRRRVMDCHEEPIAHLLIMQREHRRRLNSFWFSLRNEQCCSTMKACPLRKDPTRKW